jgi:beta-lactamase superfamily II metal-dependent hydrolase
MFLDVPPWVDGMPDNDGSMMVRIASGNASVTFTGDAGFEEEIQMMKKGSWSAQILKLGHHGSKFSTGDSWLDHVHPELAIVSCGRDNSYGHPTEEVLSKCAQRGVRVYRTDQQGSLTFRLSGGKWLKR